jgi:putative transposase
MTYTLELPNLKVMQTHYERLSDPQWEVIKKHLPCQRKRKYELRDIVDSIFWYLRIGGQWRNLPDNFPHWQSVYYYFRRWQGEGIVEEINSSLNQLYRLQIGKEPTPSLVIVDSQTVKTAAFISKEKGIDGNKKIKGRKRHILTDSLGLIWSVVVHAAHKYDGVMGEKVIAPLLGYLSRIQLILADRAYKKVFLDWVKIC